MLKLNVRMLSCTWIGKEVEFTGAVLALCSRMTNQYKWGSGVTTLTSGRPRKIIGDDIQPDNDSSNTTSAISREFITLVDSSRKGEKERGRRRSGRKASSSRSDRVLAHRVHDSQQQQQQRVSTMTTTPRRAPPRVAVPGSKLSPCEINATPAPVTRVLNRHVPVAALTNLQHPIFRPLLPIIGSSPHHPYLSLPPIGS